MFSCTISGCWWFIFPQYVYPLCTKCWANWILCYNSLFSLSLHSTDLQLLSIIAIKSQTTKELFIYSTYKLFLFFDKFATMPQLLTYFDSKVTLSDVRFSYFDLQVMFSEIYY